MNKFKKKDVVSFYKSFKADEENEFFTDEETGHFGFRGVVSDESMDRDGEVVSAKALSEASEGYLEFGSLREMHAYDKVIGRVKKVWQVGKKTFIEAFVVDPLTVEKIKTGVLTGLSIGFCIEERDAVNKNIITKLKWFETSVVDIPSNYSALIGAKNAKINFDEDEITEVVIPEVPVVVIPATPEVPVNLEALEKEALDILNAELELSKAEVAKLKTEIEAINNLSLEDKKVVKSFKSLSLVSDKYKEENSTLKSSIELLTKEIETLKNKEINIKGFSGVQEKETDYSQFEVKGASENLRNAASLAKAIILANNNK